MWIFKNRYFQIFLVAGLLAYLFIEAQGEGDLFIYFCAADDLSEGKDFFRNNYLGGFHYYYSVLFAWFLSLFKSLPFYGIKFCWLFLNAALFVHLFILLRDSEFVKSLTEKKRQYFLLFVGIFSFRFFHQNIHFAQVTILILWTCIYSLVSFEKGNTLKGSALLALGINIKLLPLVLLPYLLYRGFFKGFFLCIGFYLFSLILPSVLIGHQFNMDLLFSWYQLINPSAEQHILDTDERSFHGLSTLLATLFISDPPDPHAMSLKRNIADVPVETLKLILLIVRAALISFTLFFMKWPPFKKAASPQQRITELAYILVLIPLIFPHQQHYAFLFIVPAFAVILYYLIFFYESMFSLERKTVSAALIFIYLTANLTILIGEFNRYYEHYKTLTYGALLLIPLLIHVNRNKRSYLGTSEKK